MTSTTVRSARFIALAAAASAACLALAACGGSGGTAESTSATSAAPTSAEPPAPNPSPEGDCSKEALNSAATNATGGSFGGVEEFTCDGGWAVVSGKMNDQYTNLLFQAQDGSWMPQEIQETCQAGGLPAAISEIACA